jgi:hypothetical protein
LAGIEFEDVLVECHCPVCYRPFRPTDVVFACPDCGMISGNVRQVTSWSCSPWRCPEVADPATPTTILVGACLKARNDQQAQRSRDLFGARGLVTLNLLSSPGSGKPALLEHTLVELGPERRIGVIVGTCKPTTTPAG